MRNIVAISAFSLLSFSVSAAGDVHFSKDPAEKTFYQNTQRLPDKYYQAELRELPAWKSFLQRNGNWWVLFNEDNRKPHRAFGTPISVSGTTAIDKAIRFIQQELSGFRIPVSDLQLMGTPTSEKYDHVNFYQTYQGLKVLDSRMTVKLTKDGRVAMFGADVFSDIFISTSPALSSASAGNIASSGLTDAVQAVTVDPDLMILPVPKDKSYEYHLVYKVDVQTLSSEMVPSDYYTLVDAVNGEVLYRANLVKHFHPNQPTPAPMPATIEMTVESTVYTTHSYDPTSVVQLPNLNMTIGGNTYVTDMTGYVNTAESGTQTATLQLSGLWSVVRTNNVVPTITPTVNDGPNAVTFDNNSTIQERSAYYSVNRVHDHCKAVLPSFTGMDFTLPTNIDLTSGNCNAFYNGTSINFYAQANGCTSFATIADVVYHEYGHGINDNFYSDNGGNFANGAMGEGYADFWAYSLTLNPVVGVGTSTTNTTDFIRRYDQDRKVYPINIVGEVHADGEIIAGAWWDTYLNLGNDMNLTLQLFAEAYPGLQANTFNGNEGQAFTDVLIDVLMADDTDADITNGTPNGQAIVDAFDLHGITLISNATLNHTDVLSAPENQTIPIVATLNLNFPYTNYLDEVYCYYKINNAASFTEAAMTNTGGNTYTLNIPAQPIGTVITYYIGAKDIHGLLTAVKPIGAEAVDPNVPYYTMVGFNLEKTDDVGDNLTELGLWTITLPTDNNTTGDWIGTIPVGSFSDPNDPSTMVQTDANHTPGGDICFVTANAASPTDALGTADVDGGVTTLLSPTMDLSAYANPTFSYWRWYTNNPPSGANPNADWWQVYISNNNGASWIPVEETKSSDRSWRRVVFRVQDYVTPNSTVSIKFMASDSIRPGQNLDGGSLVEAALDDIQLWDNIDLNSVNEVSSGPQFSVFPNPANDQVVLVFESANEGAGEVFISDVTGRKIASYPLTKGSGLSRLTVNVSQLPVGSYTMTYVLGESRTSRSLVITR